MRSKVEESSWIKWKFDPDELRPGYFTWPERLKRRWQRIKFGLDFF